MTSGFVDEARVVVRAGDGADGVASFAREKYRPMGGPNGGDGGHGGSVVLYAEPERGTLSEYRRRQTYKAPHGGKAGSNNRRGADAPDLRLPVPVGTVVKDAGSGEILADLAKPAAEFVAARGGRGGRGNASLVSRADRVPSFAERGEPGRERELVLELRLVADVGLLGLPNAGKSTLLGALSRARPKVADYPFTTLEPYLGVVQVGEERLVSADLPGLIEGAAEGKGLGLRFLRHAERCAVLAAVVDLTGHDPVADLETVAGEVEAYAPHMVERIRVVVGNKIDLEGTDAGAARTWAEARGARFAEISAVRGDGIEALKELLIAEVRRAHEERGEPESFAVFQPVEEDRIEVTREDDAFRVTSDRVERLVEMTPMGNPRAIRHLQRRLKAMGVDAALVRAGIEEGDEVRIGEIAFEYLPEEAV